MAIQSLAAPPTGLGVTSVSEPRIDPRAQIHSFAQIVGDVNVGSGVVVAPGTSIRAGVNTPFAIGADTLIQDGVMIHGLELGRVVGDDQAHYSVWIGRQVAITHKALIHGPAYIGDRCFIGFRSTIFNARLGAGCVVMFHALIQDVEIPPGKYVPSGAIITRQEQVDQLPDVQPGDIEFAQEVLGVQAAPLGPELRTGGASYTAPIRPVASSRSSSQSNGSNGVGQVLSQSSLTSEVQQQVSQLIHQGYRLGVEHADARRYRSNAWHSGGHIDARNESQAIAALESALSQYAGEYVRLIGIDPQMKRRVLELTIQRPDGTMPEAAKTVSHSHPTHTVSSMGGNGWSPQIASSLPADVVQQVHQLLGQGYQVGTEHADTRRYRVNAWRSCAPIQSTHQGEVVRALEACLAEHAGDYVRLLGIDAHLKRRVLEVTIQRPGESVPISSKPSHPGTAPAYSAPPRPAAAQGGGGYAAAPGQLDPDVVQQVRQLLSQGHRIGLEYADARRYRANAWSTCPPVESNREADVLKSVQACLAANLGKYVRLIGIDKTAKRRVLETTIQRP